MTKAELNMLERLFAAEIEGRLLQSKSKLLSKLESEGYVQRAKREFQADRFGRIVVEGWCLTLLGNMTYCFSCDAPSGDPQ